MVSTHNNKDIYSILYKYCYSQQRNSITYIFVYDTSINFILFYENKVLLSLNIIITTTFVSMSVHSCADDDEKKVM